MKTLFIFNLMQLTVLTYNIFMPYQLIAYSLSFLSYSEIGDWLNYLFLGTRL